MNQSDRTNYYEILEVAADAPSHEIHRAYHRAKSTYSSDNPALYSMFSPEEAREILRLIEEAYTILGNPGSRKVYDDSIGNAGASSASSASSTHAMPASQTTNVPSTPAHQPMAASFETRPAPAASVQAAHQALPDFATPSARAADSTANKSAEAKQAVPTGMGKTSLSTFKIDDGFEAELAAATDFDGGLLQRTRLYKNISIDRMSEATRISRPYLMALETNDYKSLPAAVFTRGFVVQVSRILGLNEAKAATSYIKMFKAGGGK